MLDRHFNDLESLKYVVKSLYPYLTQSMSDEASAQSKKENKGKNNLSQSQELQWARLALKQQQQEEAHSSTNQLTSSSKEAIYPANILVKINVKDSSQAHKLENEFKNFFQDEVVECVIQDSHSSMEGQDSDLIATLNSWKDTAIYLIQSSPSGSLDDSEKKAIIEKITAITGYFNDKILNSKLQQNLVEKLLNFALAAFQMIIREVRNDLQNDDLIQQFINQNHLYYQNNQKVIITIDQNEREKDCFIVRIDRFNLISDKEYQDLSKKFAIAQQDSPIKNILRKNKPEQTKNPLALQQIFEFYQLIDKIILKYKNANNYSEPTNADIIKIFNEISNKKDNEKILFEEALNAFSILKNHFIKNGIIDYPILNTYKAGTVIQKINIPDEIKKIFSENPPRWFKKLPIPDKNRIINLFGELPTMKSKKEIERLSDSELYTLNLRFDRYQESTYLYIYPAEGRLEQGGGSMRPYKVEKKPSITLAKIFHLQVFESGAKFFTNLARSKFFEDNKQYEEQKKLLLKEPKLSDLNQHFVFQMASLRGYIEKELLDNDKYSKEKEQKLAPLIRYFNLMVEIQEREKSLLPKTKAARRLLYADKAYTLYALLAAYNPIVKAYFKQLGVPNYPKRLAMLIRNDFRYQMKLAEKHVRKDIINDHIKSIVRYANEGSEIKKDNRIDKINADYFPSNQKLNFIFEEASKFFQSKLQARSDDNESKLFCFSFFHAKKYNNNYASHFLNENTPLFAKKVFLYALLTDEKSDRDKKFQNYMQAFLGNFDTNLEYLKSELALEIKSEIWSDATTKKLDYELSRKYFRTNVLDKIIDNYKGNINSSVEMQNSISQMVNAESMLAQFEIRDNIKHSEETGQALSFLHNIL